METVCVRERRKPPESLPLGEGGMAAGHDG